MTEKHTLESIVTTGKIVEAFLREYCYQEFSQFKKLHRVIEYCLSDVGVRLRPFLLRASYETGQGSFDEVLPIAVGIELMQLSTLIIDDVLDDSSRRNGKPSVFKKWGMKRAIISGTVMSSAGLALISDTLEQNNNLKNGLTVLRLLARTHTDIYIGQFMDLEFEGNTTVSEQQYLKMISKTTACFIQAPLVTGPMLWDAHEDIISILKEVGLKLGMAYQLRDDVIDVIGESDHTGKPRAIDIRDRKMRLPVIHALTYLGPRDRGRLLELWSADKNFYDSEVEEVIDLLKIAGSVKYTIKQTEQFCLEANAMINMLDTEFEILADHLRSISSLISFFDES